MKMLGLITKNQTSEIFFNSLGKRLRRNIRRFIRRLSDKGSIIVWVVQLDSQDIESAINDYYKLYSKSWKGTELEPYFHKTLAHHLAKKDKLRLFLLYYREGKTISH